MLLSTYIEKEKKVCQELICLSILNIRLIKYLSFIIIYDVFYIVSLYSTEHELYLILLLIAKGHFILLSYLGIYVL